MKILNNKILTVIFSVMAIFALSGCGSSGMPSDDNLVGTTPVVALNIDAGQDKDVVAGHNVSLHGVAKMSDGSSSFDVSWTQEDGNFSVVLNNADTFNPTFTSPDVQVKTLLLFTMHVKSGDLESSDAVGIFVFPSTVPQVLTPQTITTHPSSTVMVHSTALPPAGGQTLTHTWTQISGPAVTLQTPNQPQTPFVAPGGTTNPVVIQHTVMHPTAGTTNTVTHIVHIVAPTTQLSVLVTPPKMVYETLTGSLHLSVSGGTMPYGVTWTQTGGSALPLDTSDPLNPTFTAGTVDKDEVIELTVVVTDGGGKSITKLIPLTIKNVTLNVTASADALVHSSHITHLHAIPVESPVLNPITYLWSEVGGSSTTIKDADTANPEITLPAGSASYTFKVEATDAAGNTATDTVSITALDDLHVDAGKNFVALENTLVHLTASSTGALGTAHFSWKQISGSAITLQGADTLNPSFTAPFTKSTTSEKFTFELTVTDDKRSASGKVNVQIAPVLPAVDVTGQPSIPVSSSGTTGGAFCSTTGGYAPFTFTWSVVPGGTVNLIPLAHNDTESFVNIHASSSVNSPVTLTCEAKDVHGRTVEATYNISIYDVPSLPTLSATASISPLITEDQVGILSVSAQGGSGPYQYDWNISDPAKGTIDDHTTANTFFTPSLVAASGTTVDFYVKVTDDLGATLTKGPLTMTIDSIPLVLSPIVGPSYAISHRNFSLSVKPKSGSGSYTYQWYMIDIHGNSSPISGATKSDQGFIAPYVECITPGNSHNTKNCKGVRKIPFTYFVKVIDTVTTQEVISSTIVLVNSNINK